MLRELVRVSGQNLSPSLQPSVSSRSCWLTDCWTAPGHLNPAGSVPGDVSALTERSSSVPASCPRSLLQQQMQINLQKGYCRLLPSLEIEPRQGCCLLIQGCCPLYPATQGWGCFPPLSDVGSVSSSTSRTQSTSPILQRAPQPPALCNFSAVGAVSPPVAVIHS